MFSIPAITGLQLATACLMFARIAGMLFTVPLFNEKAIPTVLKVGVSLLLTMILLPLQRPGLASPAAATDLPVLIWGLFRELALGITIGFLAAMVLAGIQMAGQLMGFQMGFSVVNVIDPVSSVQVSIIAQLHYLVALLVFLALGAHHWFLRALNESFRLIPLGGFVPGVELLPLVLRYAGNVFVIAVKLGAPLMVALLLCNLILGVLARTVPQMNIFIVGYPVQIALGLLVLALAMPHTLELFRHLYRDLFRDVLHLLAAAA
jgi:flagellar biosynthetic protein FliR